MTVEGLRGDWCEKCYCRNGYIQAGDDTNLFTLSQESLIRLFERRREGGEVLGDVVGSGLKGTRNAAAPTLFCI